LRGDLSERALLLAPFGRDATLAASMLAEADIQAALCDDLPALVSELRAGAGLAVITGEALQTADVSALAVWLQNQPEWSDFPFILLTRTGGGLESNPAARRYLSLLGNVSFLERPFHPTTLISLAQSALRGRRRQYEARAHLEALRQDRERLKLLAAEVDHRAKNLLAVVQSVLRLTRATTIEGYVDALQGRILALGRAHSLLSESRWEGADLHRLIDEELAPYMRGSSARAHADGPAVVLTAPAAQAIAMAIHELATNAVKHGALAWNGHVTATWAIDPSSGLTFTWLESGGAAIAPPTRNGTGKRLIERVVRDQLDGKTTFEWRPEGLRFTLRVPGGNLARSASDTETADALMGESS
jgi:two-component sensor histidine kinase